jgi:hypothetical protein
MCFFTNGYAYRVLVVGELDVPRLRDLSRPSAVLSGSEWAIACQIDGRVTVRELAGRSGISPRDAIRHVTRLVESGLCAIDAVPPPDPAQRRQSAGLEPPAYPEPALPRRRRGTAPPAGPPRALPDLALLEQILNGLQSLDLPRPGPSGAGEVRQPRRT